MSKSLQRDFIIAFAMLGGVLVLLWFGLRDLGGSLPDIPGRRTGRSWDLFQHPATPTGSFVSGAGSPSLVLGTNQWNGFFTTYFQPQPKPAPKPPATRKLDLTYLGFLQAGSGPRKALVQDGSTQRIGAIGSNLVANLFVASIEPRVLVLTNTEGQTNRLEFRSRTTLEVPTP